MRRRTRALFAMVTFSIALSRAWPAAQSAGAAQIDFATYLGGSNVETVSAVRVDTRGNIYLAGSTRSADFPTTTSLFEPPETTGRTAGFLIKLQADRTVVYSTYLARPVADLAVDAAGNAIVADTLAEGSKFGSTDDVVVTKIAADGSAVLYSVRLSGSRWERVSAIAIDSAGGVALTGETTSPDFPLVRPLQSTVPPGSPMNATSAFITRLDAEGRIEFSTGWGGTGEDAGTAIAVDRNLDIVVAGTTASSDFPVNAAAFQRRLASTSCATNVVPCRDVFILRLGGDGQSVRYSTLYGGSGGETAAALALDGAGSVHLAGVTASPDLPLRNALQPSCDSSRLVTGCSSYIAKFSPDGASLQYATFFGSKSYYVYGPGLQISGLAVDAAGELVATGTTQGNDLPLLRAFQAVNGGGPLFKSIDDGASWHASGAGLAGTGVWQLMSVGRPPVLYTGPLGSSAFRSDDRGSTWRSANVPEGTQLAAVDPLAPSILYAIGLSALMKSIDGGVTWSRLPFDELSDASLGMLAIAPSSPSNLYVAVRRGVFHSPNGGITWSLILNTDPAGDLSRPYVQGLEVDPRNADAVYAMFNEGSVRRRSGGAQWTALASLPCPANQLAFAGGVSPAIYARSCGRVYTSVDEGGSWREVGFADRTAAWVTVDPVASNNVYVASAHNGVYRSRDHGQTWTRIREPLEQDVRAVLADPVSPGTIYIGATDASNAFITRFSPSGELTFSSYLGGLRTSAATVAVDRNGDILVGGAAGAQFPIVRPVQKGGYHGAGDAFVARIRF